MNDLRRISTLGILLIVLLRIGIGWQFLYEGMWKWDTQDSPNPWSARGFLANAQGPMRGVFRSMAGDPDDTDWLGVDEETNTPLVQYRWDDWLQEFGAHYELDDRQFNRLARVVQGPTTVASDTFEMPEDVKIEGRLGKLVTYDPEDSKLLLQTAVYDADQYWHPKYHLVPADRVALMKLVPDVTEQPRGVFVSESDLPGHVAFAEQVHLLYERQKNLSYFERLRASVLGDPDLVTVHNEGEDFEGSVDATRVGKIDQYKRRLEAYEKKLEKADIAFKRSHLEYEWKELQAMKAELVGPIKQLEADMKVDARNMLTADQRALGPLPSSAGTFNPDTVAIWALMILGLMLMLGLGARIAAVLGGGMLLTFYMVWPPFPGVPEAPGPEHALWINKNSIEALALFVIATLPTGTWFGLDGIFSGCCRRRKPSDTGKKSPTVPPLPDAKEVGSDTLSPTAALSGDATPESIDRLSEAAGGKSDAKSDGKPKKD